VIQTSLEGKESRDNLPNLIEASSEEKRQKGRSADASDDGRKLHKAMRVEFACLGILAQRWLSLRRPLTLPTEAMRPKEVYQIRGRQIDEDMLEVE
jgi:hypothetical protein